MAWRVSCALSCNTEACANPANANSINPAKAAPKIGKRLTSALAFESVLVVIFNLLCPSHPTRWLVSTHGRSPGLRVIAPCRLPRDIPSGLLAIRFPLTVAGAAAASGPDLGLPHHFPNCSYLLGRKIGTMHRPFAATHLFRSSQYFSADPARF